MEANRKRTELQLVGQNRRRLLGEGSTDLGTTIGDCGKRARSRDDSTVQDDGELVLHAWQGNQPLGDGAELFGTGRVEFDEHAPLVGGNAGGTRNQTRDRVGD